MILLKKKVFIGVVLVLSSILLALIIYLFIILIGNSVVNEQNLVPKATTVLVNEDGEELTKLFIENREPVPIQEIPTFLLEAFVAIEDTRYYEHQGIDIRSIGRALYRDILAGAKVEGASTITQQLAKNVFLTNEKTWLRKTKEVLIAMNLERKYSKDEILEMYLNTIYFGHGAYGVQVASELYFDKDVHELSVDEAAILAGMVKAPNSYSPITNLERSKERRDLVLRVMHQQGYLSAEEATTYQEKAISVEHNQFTENEAYFTYIDMVLDEAAERYQLSTEDVLTGGYTIVVPMNKELQETSYAKLQEDRYFPAGNGDAEAAFVLLDSETGGVIAAHGGRDYVRRGLNRVNVKRQPGSTLKPLAVFAPAMEGGMYHPYSLLKDELVDYDGYTPRNYDSKYNGQVTMYDAITRSVNAPAVWLLNEIGIDTSLDLLQQFNLEITDQGLAIALGGLSEGITPLELANAYRVFAKEGKITEHHFIKEIYNRYGERIGQASGEEHIVVSPQTAWYMTRMLESVVTDGTGKQGFVSTPLAGKTGSTSYPEVEGATMDAWFVGYTPNVVGSLWMGYDVNSESTYLKGGSSYPTVLFKEMVNELPASQREVAFRQPDGVKELEPPVQMHEIDDLTATLSMGGKGLLSIHLKWSADEDKRIYYQVYEQHKGETKQIATVVGDHQYLIGTVNPFSQKHYFVVPYDSITEQLGEKSNLAQAKFQFGFH